MNKGLFIGLFVIFILLGGCGSNTAVDAPTPEDSEQNTSVTDEEKNAAKPEEQTEEQITTENITVFYTDPELTKLISHNSAISYKEESDKYKETFVQLSTSPNSSYDALWRVEQLNDIRHEEDGTLMIDVSITQHQVFGSTGELFSIDAILNTFFQFEEVERIQFLVDGKKAESLMGHVEISKPFERP